jgi:uncharacterized alpha/beta hydrolase family protein
MKKYIVEVIIIIMILFMIFWAYIRFTVTEEVKVEPYQPYQSFAVVVEETTWDGYKEVTKIVK